MRKRVLVAEQSDVIRGVAESLLRQNGYEVISVSNAEKAREVLQMTRPDIMIVGSDLTGVDGRLFYEKIQSESKTSSIPLLLFRNSDDHSLPFPEEVLISRPFDPREFIERISVFSGQGGPASLGEPNPLAADLDDEFLDAALGLDKIDVTDSQVMDKTVVGSRKPQKRHVEKMIGIEAEVEDSTNSGRVEMVTLEDTTSINLRKAAAKQMSGTSKLEILSDQYGMANPDVLKQKPPEQAHDYEWFLNEMKQTASESPATPQQATAQQPAKKSGQSGKLEVHTSSSFVDPITPAQQPSSTAAPAKKSAGVDKFISEFKHEIEKFRSEEPESITIESDSSIRHKGDSHLPWQEQFEKLSPEEMGLFTKQLARDIADKVAEKIISKIDADKLMILIKNEIINRTRS